jgi:hypothetical protein
MTALQPWLTLHFNCAIIATRTQQPELMNAAFDLLETHLPQHCPVGAIEAAVCDLLPVAAGCRPWRDGATRS